MDQRPNEHLNETHDPNLKSWVESANDPATDFPIQNLPLCAFEAEHDGHTHTHLGVAIGDSVLDLSLLAMAGIFGDPENSPLANLLHAQYWNAVARSPAYSFAIRRKAQEFLHADAAAGGGQQIRRLRQRALRPLRDTQLSRPVFSMNYTDFYASKHHATNVGAMFRPDNPILPNYRHVPIGYHGRASSIVPSGTPIRRPWGQQAPPEDNPGTGPGFGPCKMLDYELELGLIVGRGNELGHAIPLKDVRDHIFGVCILNDWSARDLQKWEYQPLGPFLAKNFASTISPFIVTLEALEPFRVPGPSRDADDPQPLPYLQTADPWGYDISVEVLLSSAQMRERGIEPAPLSKGSFKDLYWTFAQMLVHHASNGCNLQPGDLLGSGTISGTAPSTRGCLLELTWQGNGPDKKPLPRQPVTLPTGETRSFLQDGDEVIMRAACEREGFRRIGFGECRGTILAATESPS
ncbi:MAG: fumarylacetoacetase [Phycisphaeraceae bacterium]|nr:fumarylacetoacetase [Phycisphaeraceae bacterium]